MEGWWEDELDIDDSDIQSAAASLRPCNSLNISSDSRSSSTLILRNSSSDLIPGPAGVLQFSMIFPSGNHLTHLPTSDPSFSSRHCSSPIDSDFLSIPWLTALDFVRNNGLIAETIKLGESISSIKELVEIGRVPQVIGIITSCKPNGLGDLTVMLKDLSGSIVGSIHHKALLGEFGKNITVGSVLILQKVSFFFTAITEHCLNITRRNLIKVVPVEIVPEQRSEDEHVVPAMAETHGTASVVSESTSECGYGPQTTLNGIRSCENEEKFHISEKGWNSGRTDDISRDLVPEWTDEQLDELFTFDNGNYEF